MLMTGGVPLLLRVCRIAGMRQGDGGEDVVTLRTDECSLTKQQPHGVY